MGSMGRNLRSIGHDAERAYLQLRDLIVSGRLAVGVQLIERQVGERLGVGRAAVAKAFQKLSQGGYVHYVALGKYSRPEVAPLTIDDMEELYAILGALDGVGARRAALLPLEDRLALVDDLRALNRRLLKSSQGEQQDISAVFELDDRLHRTIIERVASPRLWERYDSIKPQAERYGRVYASAQISVIPQSVEEHDEIISAIEKGEPDEAQNAARRNWMKAMDRFRGVMVEVGEQEKW